MDYQRVLDVLLHDPVAAFAFPNVLQDIAVFGENGDPSASRLVARFDDPKVLVTIQMELLEVGL